MTGADEPRVTRLSHDRDFDVVLLGATGFTGTLTARHLAEHGPAGLRWAVAGRDPSRLDQLVESLADAPCPPSHWAVVETPEPGDEARTARLEELVQSTAVLVTTVGPYLELGEPVVKACATHGTHYLDLTGEPEFVDRMFDLYDDVARASGARLVHSCGFDSIPHDLGVQFVLEKLAAGGALTEPVTVQGVVRTAGTVSGGTFHSALGAFARQKQARQAADRRRRREPRPPGRIVRVENPRPRRDQDSGLWLVALPTIDPAVVARSARALPAYGTDFTYAHLAGIQRTSTLAKAGLGLGALAVAARIGPLRKLVGSRIPRGSGPSEERRDRGWFTVDFTATSGGRTAKARVSGGDPGYTETSKMLAESALCLVMDDVPDVAGQVTTAVAFGPLLRERLVARGMEFISET
ncbi:saccharopine dehydrogenase family protein [Nocardioides yefusunii]|uniref:Saccharopine dehydrogenase family protein n=1 Tax=Nocardioides yefusunii TaxID=2500546 RepID=A0ABW1QZW4_9ACTN|nr:saccharopine dehydrogenase NADP-binding domain-containing protein [Nocardioides yefusunii]